MLLSCPDSLSGLFFALLGVYLFFTSFAAKLHFFLGVFFHFITGDDIMKQGEATNSLPVEAPREFDRVARRWNVDYAFYKNGEGKYLLFFKSKQADAITACFGEYSHRIMDRPRARRVPILERMKRAGELLRQRPRKERAKEAEREER